MWKKYDLKSASLFNESLTDQPWVEDCCICLWFWICILFSHLLGYLEKLVLVVLVKEILVYITYVWIFYYCTFDDFWQCWCNKHVFLFNSFCKEMEIKFLIQTKADKSEPRGSLRSIYWCILHISYSSTFYTSFIFLSKFCYATLDKDTVTFWK